jgi:hypothetical protein
MHKVAVALIHHPVVDKNGQAITAAVTALDLHDIARAAKTFGAGAYYVVTPLQDQQTLVRQIIDHWVTGYGAGYNPDRRSALALIRMQPSLAAVVDEIEQIHGRRPCTVVTSARSAHKELSCAGLRALILRENPVLLIFGTAWGLAPAVLAQADYRLAPIRGVGDYNHLAVRSAVSIILDRISDQREAQ